MRRHRLWVVPVGSRKGAVLNVRHQAGSAAVSAVCLFRASAVGSFLPQRGIDTRYGCNVQCACRHQRRSGAQRAGKITSTTTNNKSSPGHNVCRWGTRGGRGEGGWGTAAGGATCAGNRQSSTNSIKQRVNNEHPDSISVNDHEWVLWQVIVERTAGVTSYNNGNHLPVLKWNDNNRGITPVFRTNSSVSHIVEGKE